MDLKSDVKWIETTLLESGDPTIVEAVKNLVQSMQKMREYLLQPQMEQNTSLMEPEPIDAYKHLGKISLNKDALDIQREFRNEWG